MGRTVCIAPIRYSDSISTVPKNEQLHVEKRTCAKFQDDISKWSKGPIRVYTRG